MQIYYPLHPLSGQRLWVRERRAGPPPTYYVVTPSGEGFSVPVWMTDPAACSLRREDRPRIHVRALLEIVCVMGKGLESSDRHAEILPSDQAKEIPDDDRTTPIGVDTRRQPEKAIPGAAALSPNREPRVGGTDAGPPRARSENNRKETGGPR